ncbi:unnamed protein product [Strongylus vulgaris]|uniref:Extracellular Endonuclease subunit A domain-containing protein n=1 Tax=Strongylus vulgaris TaxID=40348 RepID=A0A3P7IHK7_STRVU|nr:unnamed protein product [Strongylus vulgaris]
MVISELVIYSHFLDQFIRDLELNLTKADIAKPIWLAYKEQTDGITALHSWSLQPFEAHHPDYYVFGNDSTPLQEQLNTALEWLKMDAFSRPGLIMIYCKETLKILENVDESVVQKSLAEVDGILDRFFGELNREAILDCVNVVVLSDEGLTNGLTMMDVHQYSSGYNVSNPNPLTTIHAVESGKFNRSFTFSCSKENSRKIFLPSTLPTRWHSSLSENSGDILLSTTLNGGKCRHVDTESDCPDEGMQTFFFAQGPSFNSGLVLPKIQNIELMNLWLDLLNMHYLPNNGTIGIMDEALRKPKRREKRRRFGIRECPFVNEEFVINCGGCTALQQARITKWMNSCDQPNRPVVLFSSSSFSPCYQKICEKLIVIGTDGDDSLALVELFHQNNTVARSESDCRYVNSRYRYECPTLMSSEGYELRSLSPNPKKVLAREATIQVSWKSTFITDVLDPLNDYTLAISKELGRVICITGTAYDRNFDGIADKERRGSPSHLYRILIACSSGWSSDGFTCTHARSTKVLAFIFPHMDRDANCLPSRELLLLYTARLKDVELIAGMDIDLPGVSATHALYLKVSVVNHLW